MSKLGHLDRVEAFEFANYLCLTGSGSKFAGSGAKNKATVEIACNEPVKFQSHR